MIQVEPTRWPILFYDTQGSCQFTGGATEGAIIQVPCVDIETWYFSLDPLHDGLEGQSEAQGPQWIPLLNPASAQDLVITEVENGLGPIAAFHPGCQRWNVCSDFLKHAATVDAVERVREIQQENPAIFRFDGWVF